MKRNLLACGPISVAMGLAVLVAQSAPAAAEANTDQGYSKFTAAYAKAFKDASTGRSGDQVKYGYSDWLDVFNEADSFTRAFCEGSPAAARCGEVTASLAKAGEGVAGYFKACFAHPKYDWYDILETLVRAQNRKPFLDKMPELDTWMQKLGADKAAYWIAEAKTAGGWPMWVKKNGEGICYSTDSRGAKTPTYSFGTKGKAYMSCFATKKRSELNGKPKDDFLRIYVMPRAYYLDNELKVKVKWKADTGTFELPMDDIRIKLAAKADTHIGPWAYVRVELRHAWITGKGWKDQGGSRVWGDVWDNAKVGAGTFLVKIR